MKIFVSDSRWNKRKNVHQGVSEFSLNYRGFIWFSVNASNSHLSRNPIFFLICNTTLTLRMWSLISHFVMLRINKYLSKFLKEKKRLNGSHLNWNGLGELLPKLIEKRWGFLKNYLYLFLGIYLAITWSRGILWRWNAITGCSDYLSPWP